MSDLAVGLLIVTFCLLGVLWAGLHLFGSYARNRREFLEKYYIPRVRDQEQVGLSNLVDPPSGEE